MILDNFNEEEAIIFYNILLELITKDDISKNHPLMIEMKENFKDFNN